MSATIRSFSLDSACLTTHSASSMGKTKLTLFRTSLWSLPRYRPAQAMLSLAKVMIGDQRIDLPLFILSSASCFRKPTTVESTRIPSGPSPPFIGLSSRPSDQGVTIFRKQPLSSDHAFVSTPS
jgi:hypothetical protein